MWDVMNMSDFFPDLNINMFQIQKDLTTKVQKKVQYQECPNQGKSYYISTENNTLLKFHPWHVL